MLMCMQCTSQWQMKRTESVQRRLRKARKFLDEDGHGSQYADGVTIRM